MTVPDDEFISALADGAASARKAIATIEGSNDELRAEVAAGDRAGYDAIRAGLGGPDDPVLDACFELGTAMSEAGLGTLECLDAPISDEPPAGETEGAPPTLPDLGPGRAVQLVLTADAEAGESTGPFTVVDGSDALGSRSRRVAGVDISEDDSEPTKELMRSTGVRDGVVRVTQYLDDPLAGNRVVDGGSDEFAIVAGAGDGAFTAGRSRTGAGRPCASGSPRRPR